jgi:hypothetical protein
LFVHWVVTQAFGEGQEKKQATLNSTFEWKTAQTRPSSRERTQPRTASKDRGLHLARHCTRPLWPWPWTHSPTLTLLRTGLIRDYMHTHRRAKRLLARRMGQSQAPLEDHLCSLVRRRFFFCCCFFLPVVTTLLLQTQTQTVPFIHSRPGRCVWPESVGQRSMSLPPTRYLHAVPRRAPLG